MSVPLRPDDLNGFLHRASSVINRFNRSENSLPAVFNLEGFVRQTKSIHEDLKRIEVALLQQQVTNRTLTGVCTLSTIVGGAMCFFPATAPAGYILTTVGGMGTVATKVVDKGNNILKAKEIQQTLTQNNYDQAMVQAIREYGLEETDMRIFREVRDKSPFEFDEFKTEIGKGITYAVDLYKNQNLLKDFKHVHGLYKENYAFNIF